MKFRLNFCECAALKNRKVSLHVHKVPGPTFSPVIDQLYIAQWLIFGDVENAREQGERDRGSLMTKAPMPI
jgi:hypothetical protein